MKKPKSIHGITVGDVVLCPSGRLAKITALNGEDKFDAVYLRGSGNLQTILNPRQLVKVVADQNAQD